MKRKSLSETTRGGKPDENSDATDKMLGKFHPEVKEEEMIRTTIFLTKSLAKELKVYCAMNEITQKNFIVSVLKWSLLDGNRKHLEGILQ